MDPHKVILYPIMGEKATTMREKENKLSFIVDKKSAKNDIKAAVETLYNVKVVGIQSQNTTTGEKKVHVRLDSKYSAEEIASHFGVL
jgi:large subunit ribosomal protein L23